MGMLDKPRRLRLCVLGEWVCVRVRERRELEVRIELNEFAGRCCRSNIFKLSEASAMRNRLHPQNSKQPFLNSQAKFVM